ncbi:MAG: D-alanine-D-alanine ligase [Parcubacteria group bacterium Gr01-1014_56]|nr:MAG: D-alanine-D-alanine ligase [Parcubacteria group bacterium Gr01-1014_56]
MLGALDKEKYEPRDLFIDRQGQWHHFGVPVTPEKALRGVDVAINVVHGEYGEDGRLHEILDSLAVPYTGSDKTASILAFNKARSKQAVKKINIKTPRAIVVSSEDARGDIEGLAYEIFPFFDYDAKYSGKTLERVPGNFTAEQKEELMSAACKIHETLGLSHYSRSDFIVGRRGVYFLEINNASGVGMSDQSLFPKALDAVGARMPDFIEHIIELAQKGKKIKIRTS